MRITKMLGVLLSFSVLVSCGGKKLSDSDGRVAKCGVITEQGVTEHLDIYKQRCG